MRKVKLKLIVGMLSLLILSVDSQAKGWRGIVPLTSTKKDVSRLFGKCTDNNPSCEFIFKNESVHIEFSGTATSDVHACSRQLRPDTVLLIEVTPQKALEFSDLRLNKKRLRAFDLSPPDGTKTRGYIDDNQGLILKTYDGKIVQLDYIAGAKDRHLCQDYYENPELFVHDIFSSHAPAIALHCPTKTPQAGESIRFDAYTTGKPKLTFLWSVSPGRIIVGQGTPKIMVDTAGLQGQLMKVRVKLGGVGASCDVQISP